LDAQESFDMCLKMKSTVEEENEQSLDLHVVPQVQIPDSIATRLSIDIEALSLHGSMTSASLNSA
jgi:hypothetical protein